MVGGNRMADKVVAHFLRGSMLLTELDGQDSMQLLQGLEKYLHVAAFRMHKLVWSDTALEPLWAHKDHVRMGGNVLCTYRHSKQLMQQTQNPR